MPSCQFGDPLDPFARYPLREMKEDLEGMFEDDLLNGVDLTRLDIDDLDLSVFDNGDYDDESEPESYSKFLEIRNHDCMIGGQCCNKEYQRTVAAPVARPLPPLPPAPAPPPRGVITHSTNKVVTIQKCVPVGKCSDRTDVVVVTNKVRTSVPKNEGRSLLLNRTPVNPPHRIPTARKVLKRECPTPHSSRPETPQSLSETDDEFCPIPLDPHNTTSIFRSALDALTTHSTEWVDEYQEGKRTKVEKDPVPSQTDIMWMRAKPESDHNYHETSKNMRLEGLGVDTPSDSEEDEEIDVVSLSDRSCSRSSSCGGLPTRPTMRDQEDLEEITTSLLSASEAVSRKLKKTITTKQSRHRRKTKYQTDSSDEEEMEDEDEYMETQTTDYRMQSKQQKASPSRAKRKKTSRFGDEEDSQEKRDLHNNMERMRRIDLRKSFEDLKGLVPNVCSRDRVAKVSILQEAASYCGDLGAQSQNRFIELMTLRKEQDRLRRHLSNLRKSMAYSRRGMVHKRRRR